jgi:hypothetical protein
VLSDLTRRIDTALAALPAVESGLGAYRRLTAQLGAAGNDPAALAQLREGIVELAAARYRGATAGTTEMVEFEDRSISFLFDCALERAVLIHGISAPAAPNGRDNSYHRGFVPMPPGYDKGHAAAHGQGGFEGGPNYFPQLRNVNQRRSDLGNLWREIEDYVRRHAGMFFFVRLIYARPNRGWIPDEVEYGVLDGGKLRAVIFPNR